MTPEWSDSLSLTKKRPKKIINQQNRNTISTISISAKTRFFFEAPCISFGTNLFFYQIFKIPDLRLASPMNGTKTKSTEG